MHFHSVRFYFLVVTLSLAECQESYEKFSQVSRWAKSGFQYLKMNLCQRVSSLSETECRRLSVLRESGVAIYVSEVNSEKVVAVLPDSKATGLRAPKRDTTQGDGKRHQDVFPGPAEHDGVLVLDPSPGENFGHPVVIFYVDFNVTKKKCGHRDGIFLGEECMTLALNSRCQNQLKPRQSRSERMGRKGRARRGMEARPGRAERSEGLCEIHFLPQVVLARNRSKIQQLYCAALQDFARCPEPLPISISTVPISNCELNKNTRRCHQQPLATHLSCRLYQTCDHAVLLSGGWQQQITYRQHVNNLQIFYSMLRNNGFHKDHIKTFFAGNGLDPEEVEGVYPATEKEVIRNHISYVCRKQHCADTFVLYLNNPTRNDGTMLLWDSNHNGIADPMERYTVSELLVDLAGCRARRVLLFVEQSYSTTLAKRLRGSLKHVNVALLGSAYRTQTASFWGSLHPSHCLIEHLDQVPATPQPVNSSPELLNVTLAGAPCNLTPPLTEAEMRKQYMGCQNLPTALWYQRQNQDGKK
ncbi:uncharacterized protein si:ch211-67e16.11 [Brienomyrus brachyistius]|uniref:uncharacterized protein si:ch211-67e16.11 n=1 Tax=Brienomyrus brachyistius TaxID=42636 RepID=UPI0020B44CE5|nr:uncharacterized protein si:ch211-67e16.11 [Brienomyrus brachyistius]